MFHVAYKTDVGKRRTNNQDALLVDEQLNLYMVADGMGGHQAGEIASQMTVETVSNHMKSCIGQSTIKTCILEAVTEANKKVYLASLENIDFRGMGTTCSMVIKQENDIYIGHVGDSRIYLVSDNIVQITKDHTLVEDLLRHGEITKEEAESHPKRHVITRAVGTDPTVEVDVMTCGLEGINKIVICSDGLTELVSNQEILEIVNTHSIDQAVEQLIQLANDRGGTDNITVVLLSVVEC